MAIDAKSQFYVDFNDPAMTYYVPGGHKGIFNVWEYYFNQPHDMAGKEVVALGDPMVDYLQKCSRAKLHAATKAIQLKPNVASKISRFYDGNMRGKNVVGIHYRGTDMRAWRIPTCEEFVVQALKLKGDAIFVATDDFEAAKYFRRRLKGMSIMYNATRSKKPLHGTRPSDPYRIGEDAVIESYLLARCSHIIRLKSNLSQYSIYLNSSIGYTIFAYKNRTWVTAGPGQLL